jgi:hypothetical protein
MCEADHRIVALEARCERYREALMVARPYVEQEFNLRDEGAVWDDLKTIDAALAKAQDRP